MNLKKLDDIRKIKVLVFGDYMVDRYINGNVSRISPEAPVPVVEVTSQAEKLGGAGNVINNIIALGGQVKVLGCIGNDKAGDFIIKQFTNKNIDTSYFKQFSKVDTIVKTRIVSKNQQFLRIDEEKKEPLPNDYFEIVKNNIEQILSDIDVVVISDYAKGSVTKEISQLLISNAKKKSIPVIVDPKGNDYSKYKGATLCTPNVKELSDVVNQKIDTEDKITKYGSQLCQDINLDYLVLTRSEKGISVVLKNREKLDFPAIAKEVIDVSGAGDTVVATISLLLGLNFPIDDICKIANSAASVVVSKFGTSTVSFNELICSLSNTGEFKLITKEVASYIVKDLKEKNKKVVFTNGCFDLLHSGHLSSFKKAKEFGDVLIVAVNSDSSVKENKGDLRPIINQEDRIEMICELECVDYVILMEDKDPSELIKLIKPDISIKGKDWENKYVPEKEIIESYGGEMKFIELEKGKSTTNIINKILKVYSEHE